MIELIYLSRLNDWVSSMRYASPHTQIPLLNHQPQITAAVLKEELYSYRTTRASKHENTPNLKAVIYLMGIGPSNASQQRNGPCPASPIPNPFVSIRVLHSFVPLVFHRTQEQATVSLTVSRSVGRSVASIRRRQTFLFKFPKQDFSCGTPPGSPTLFLLHIVVQWIFRLFT